MAKKNMMILLVVLVVAAGIGLFVLFGPPRVLAKSGEPDFCASCHVMEAEYVAWSYTGAHRTLKCVDCHLPNQNKFAHYVWKSIDGLKDAWFFYSGRVSERIELTEHGGEVLQANCIRCHSGTVSMISTQAECWSCHRGTQHRLSGTIETL
ncbi:cytochrome c nitrite reductase small subunit [Desulfuromonas sp. KJ2020]|uniref:cytochrome c nitrite reductase small subunit n=1 Tax=Desulfuromonas sp. KJ2020 TaxID=2919173 RepID=UPI0020A732FA|nr:cytochrome c nitrite reductase small subunit [Desulfuromonas sp. KJ2020]MCP3177019.1 cytochrome c nitrite reductase small subunit [Desulfuromonas sp. KJ2020]